MDRRDFFRLSVEAGIAAALPNESFAGAAGYQSTTRNASQFWTSEIRKRRPALSLDQAMPKATATVADETNPPSQVTSENRTPVFVYYDATKQTFLDSGDVTPSIQSGDVSVTVRVMRFRPSTSDQSIYKQVQNGSLRIDMQQTTASADVGLPLAWSVVAGLLPGNGGKLPDLSQLTFDPGTSWGKELSAIPLPQGQGLWTWNFFLQKKKSLWENILNTVDSAVKGGAPQAFFSVLGLPAIAVTALEDVDKLIAYLTAKEEQTYLFQSSDTPVAATKDAASALGPDVVHLTSGTYLIVPAAHAPYVQTSGYKISNEGLYVPAATDSLSQYAVAEQTTPQMTYLTASVQVASKSTH